ncbi:MAG TPA: bacillithiol biosynthesis cysteine-adding enzyme BshC [Terracidiphilus sp.]|nr:bacillithiol biosynthesis cysteine-adding enzyme BshC [Terracidiphilus sp.]
MSIRKGICRYRFVTQFCIEWPRHGILNWSRIPEVPQEGRWVEVNELQTAECYPVTVAPGQSRLFVDFCESNPALQPFYSALPSNSSWQRRPSVPEHWPALIQLLAAQNTSPSAAFSLAALAQGAGTVVTGQQVALLGGPLFTPFKAATAIARARQATASGHPHVPIFWLASEDHDFAEVNNVTFPTGRQLRKLVYESAPDAARPAGGITFDESITPLVEQTRDLLGADDAIAALFDGYQPGRTFAEAFALFYSRAFAAQGLLVVDASGREFHRLGSPVLRAAIERADELHAALLERNQALEAAGYHAQVAVAPQSSLLFLIDDKTGARVALKRTAPTAAEPDGLWQAGHERYSTAELMGILDAAPERISPSALLRPIFQDFLLSSSSIIGGPAEIAYFAQSGVLYDRILGRQTPAASRFSATLIEPSIAELLRRHELPLDRIFAEDASSLARLLAARSMPIETKRKLAAAGNALDAELNALVDWMREQDKGLGQSADTAASKMRYQMDRLRTLAANFQLQRENTLTRHAESIVQSLFPGGVLQERVHGAAYYFARYGLELAETLCTQAADTCPGHKAIWL